MGQTSCILLGMRGPKQGGSPGVRCALQRKTGIAGKPMWRPYAPPWHQGTSTILPGLECHVWPMRDGITDVMEYFKPGE